MKELFVIFLIVLVIYLNQTQCKTQKGGSTATKVGMGLVITAIIAVAGYFAYKEFSGPSPTPPDDSDDTGSTGSSGSTGNPVSPNSDEHGSSNIHNYKLYSGDGPVQCLYNTVPKQLCPDGTPCPRSEVCPSGGDKEYEACKTNAISVCQNDPDCIGCMGGDRIRIEQPMSSSCKLPGLTQVVCPNPGPKSGGVSIDQQGSKTVQIVNSTNSQQVLHVYFENKGGEWTKSGGNGAIQPTRNNWSGETNLYTIFGAGNYQEVIITDYIVLNIPEAMRDQGFRVIPVKPTEGASNKNTPYISSDVIQGQKPVLTEMTYGDNLGNVANLSAVDGINYLMNYSVTEQGGVKNINVDTNPCEDSLDRYKATSGNKYTCLNPTKVDCDQWGPSGNSSTGAIEGWQTCYAHNAISGSSDPNKNGNMGAGWCGTTATCKPGTQSCAFNMCSQQFFNSPQGGFDPLTSYDGGRNGDEKLTGKVKEWVMNTDNLKSGQLKEYCDKVTKNNGEYTIYCYDYADRKSSPKLNDPWKVKIEYKDLHS